MGDGPHVGDRRGFDLAGYSQRHGTHTASAYGVRGNSCQSSHIGSDNAGYQR